MSEFTQYRRTQIAEMRPIIDGDDLSNVSISAEDTKAGSPKRGDMIARNPKNHADQWLVAAQYFADNFESLPAQSCVDQGCPQHGTAHVCIPNVLIDSRGNDIYDPSELGLTSKVQS